MIVVLQGAQRNTQAWCISDPDEVARFEVGDTCERKDLLP